jgi:elongation factor G
LSDTLEGKFLPFQLPIGQSEDFKGVVNLVDMKAYLGAKGEVAEIPADMMEEVEIARQALIEAAAETDDELIVKYLDGEELSEDEVRQGLSRGVRRGEIVPVFCGSATGNIGLESLLRALTSYVPVPSDVRVPVVEGEAESELACAADGPTTGFVFKTLIDRYVGRINYLRVFSGVLHKEDRLANRRTGQEERISNLFVVRGKELEAVDELTAGDIGAVTKLESALTGDTLAGSGSQAQVAQPPYPLPLYSVAVVPATKADSAKLGQALHALTEEDPTLDIQNISATRQTVLRGMGETQIDVAKHHLESKFGTKVETSVPKVPYMETINRTASASYRHKKQTGGAGQFAEVHLRLEPRERGTGFEYASEVFGGAISHSFIPSIEKGIKQVLDIGVIAGYPVVDIKAVVFDGKEHPVDSKDIAFQTAGREAFKLAVQDAGPTLLEPIYTMEITVPDEYMGDVMGDLNTRRGRVLGMEQKNNRSVVRALIPLAEIQRYGNDLRSMTQGRGLYTIEFDHYEPVPSNLAEEIIAQSKMEQVAEHA